MSVTEPRYNGHILLAPWPALRYIEVSLYLLFHKVGLQPLPLGGFCFVELVL